MAYNREDMITWNELAPSLQTVLRGYESGIEALNSKYQEEHLSLTDLEGNLATFIQNQEAATTLLQQTVEALNGTQEVAKTNIEEINSTQSQIKSICEDIRTETQANLDRIKDTQEQIRMTSNDIHSRLEELNTNQEQVKNLASSLDTNVNTGFTTLNQSCSRMEATAENIKESGIALSATCSSLDETCGLIKTSLANLSNTVTSLYTTCQSLDTTCKSIDTTVGTIKGSVQGINTYSGNIETACRALTQTCTSIKDAIDGAKETLNSSCAGIKSALEETKEVVSSSCAEIKGLLEEIKENGISTPVVDEPFVLSEVPGGVEEFGSLDTYEQTHANTMKKQGFSNADIIAWLRNYRLSTSTFDLTANASWVEEFGSLDSYEQAQANSMKRNGSTDDDIIAWLRNYRLNNATFDLTANPDWVEEFDPLTEEEQALANYRKRQGQTDEEIIEWLRERRLDAIRFDLTVNPDWVEEFDPLTTYEQSQADTLKRNGQTDEEIIEWIRSYRASQVSYDGMLDVAADFDVHKESLAAHSNINSSKLMMHHTGTNYEVGDTVYIGELPEYMALVATTSGKTATSRVNFSSSLQLSNATTEQGKAALLAARTADLEAKLANESSTVDQEIVALYKEVFDHRYDQDAHNLTSTTKLTHKVSHAYNRLGIQVFANKLDPNFKLEVVSVGTTASTAHSDIVSTTEKDTYVAPIVTSSTRESVVQSIRSMLSDHESSTTAHYDDTTDYLFKASTSGLRFIAKDNACYLCKTSSQVFILQEVYGAVEEFGSLDAYEQEQANIMKQNGSSDSAILEWLRAYRSNSLNNNISSYAGVLDTEADLDSHEESFASHSALNSEKLMMHHTSTAYAIGDTVHVSELPSYLVLEATKAGTTNSSRSSLTTGLGVTAITEKSKVSLLATRTAAVQAKITAGTASVDSEIKALHKEVFDHKYDQDAHSNSTIGFTHKTKHAYSKVGTVVFANALEPHFVLELTKAGTTNATAPTSISKARTVADYTAPIISDSNRDEVLSQIQNELLSHNASTTAHADDTANYLFSTSSSGYQYFKLGNSYRFGQVTSAGFVLSDVPGGVEEFGSLDSYEQTHANEMKANGSSDAEIIGWLREYRFNTTNSNISSYAGVLDAAADLDVHDEAFSSHDNLPANKYMMHHTSTAYTVGDKVFIAELPAYLVLEATKAGTTNSSRSSLTTGLGVTAITEKSKVSLLATRTAAVQAKITAGSTTVNDEIAALHREVFEHQYDDNAHDSVSSCRLTRKRGHAYAVGDFVFANALDPQFMLEATKAGTTSTATSSTSVSKSRPVQTYVPITVTDSNRTEKLEEVKSLLSTHSTDTAAHSSDTADYLFDTNSSGYQYLKTGPTTGTYTNYRLCAIAS